MTFPQFVGDLVTDVMNGTGIISSELRAQTQP